MDAGVQCNKEMVDLLLKLKKHLKVHHQIALSMSDDNVMERLLALATVKDDVLQGMVQYLMALAGGDWHRRYMAATQGEQPAASPVKSAGEKFRDRLLADTALGGGARSRQPAPPADDAPEGGRIVRYYRGQPIYA